MGHVGSSDTARRLRGDRGTAFVAALVVMFAVTGGAALYLARDVNQRVSDRSAMQSIAFQSARAGAQQLDVAALRDTSGARVAIDVAAAEIAARGVVDRLSDRYELEVRIVRQHVGDGLRSWTIELAAADGSVRVRGVARAETGG